MSRVALETSQGYGVGEGGARFFHITNLIPIAIHDESR